MTAAVEHASTVLLVDDTPAILHVYGTMLRKAGYRVLTSETAAGAAELLAHEIPDVIVLDYMMPVMNGPTLLRRIRAEARLRDVAVILLTASDLDEHIEESFAAGCSDYMQKPVDRRILLARIKAMIEAKKDRLGATRADELALERDQLLRELHEARDIQGAGLPKLPLRWDDWSVSGLLLPCSHVGGDLYDVIAGSDDRHRVIVLIDVSGHGLAAAMVGSGVRTCLRVMGGRAPHEMAAELNEYLCQGQGDLYACVGIVCAGPDDLWIVNAGLPPIAIIEDGAVTQLISGHGTPPGLLPGSTYDSVRVTHRPGMRFAIVSDGMTEAFGSADDTPGALERMGLLGGDFPTQVDLTERMRSLFLSGGKSQPDDATIVMLGDVRRSRNQRV